MIILIIIRNFFLDKDVNAVQGYFIYVIQNSRIEVSDSNFKNGLAKYGGAITLLCD